MAKFDIPPQDIPLVDIKTGRMNLDWYDKLSKLQVVPDPIGAPKIISFTRVLSLASGNQSVTGVGFKPRLITWLAGGSATFSGSVGNSDGASNTLLEVIGINTNAITNLAGIVRDTAPNFQSFVLSSFDTDGFTVSWTKSGTPTSTATVFALCFR